MGVKKNTKIKSNGKEYDYYRITRTIGHKFVDGKKTPIKKQFVGSSKREAEEKYKEWLRNSTNEAERIDDARPFGKLLEEYASILSVNSKYSIGTRRLYLESYSKHLKNSPITKISMNALTSKHIQQYYTELPISKSALATLHKFIKGFFKWANINGYCENLLDGVVLPEKEVVKKSDGIIVWTTEELQNIIESEPSYVLKPFILFAAYTGMRYSELAGLTWENIKDDRIVVKQQFYRGDFVPPKGNKEREIPLHEKLREFVENADRKYKLVFCSKDGNPLNHSNVYRSLDRFYSRIGVNHKKFHAYRATFVTNLCKKGVPIQTASKLAGHENITVTAKYYASIELDEMADAISKL